MEKEREHTEIEALFNNPPQLILVFDNYRSHELWEIAEKTMQVRAAIATIIFNSGLYREDADRPLVCCFAGEHEPSAIAGSQKVAHYLRQFGIPENKILTRKNTITTTTDLIQLHATMISRALDSVVIVTTDDHAKRTQLEIKNHFGKARRHRKNPQIDVISPSSPVLDKLWAPDHFSPRQTTQIAGLIALGKTDTLNGGITERIATIVSSIPFYGLRATVQKRAEQASHPHIPNDLARIQRVAKRLSNRR